MKVADTIPHAKRYDNVDVLTLLDPNWLEHSQASRLLQMVAEEERSQTLRFEEHEHADLMVA